MENKEINNFEETGVTPEDVDRFQYNSVNLEPESSNGAGVLAALVGGTVAAAGAVAGFFAIRKAKKDAKKKEKKGKEDIVQVLESQSFVIRDVNLISDEELERQISELRSWRAANKAEKVSGEVEDTEPQQ